MSLSRRRFVSLSLLGTAGFAIGAVARAGDVSKVRLEGMFEVARESGLVRVGLAVTNTGPQAVDVLQTIGQRPGTSLEAWVRIDGEDHALLPGEREALDGELEVMTRSGPRRLWRPLLPDETLLVGTWERRWPEGVAANGTLMARARVTTSTEVVELMYGDARPAEV